MSDVMVFPDVRSGLRDLLTGSTHYDQATDSTVMVTAVKHLEVGDKGALLGPFPLAQVFVTGGTRGHVDRVDRVKVDLYAPGEQAVNVLESITAYICRAGVDTTAGYLDSIDPDVTPVEVSYFSDTLNLATATFLVTSRPL